MRRTAGLVVLAAAIAAIGGGYGTQAFPGAIAGGDPDAPAGIPAPPEPGPAPAPGAYFKAVAKAKRIEAASHAALSSETSTTLSWDSLGPSPLDGGYGPSGTTPPWSGRGTSIAVAPTDDTTAYLGTSGGGVWKTTDDGANWTPIFDQEPTLAIGAVAVDPTNKNIVYAGTGEANWQLQGGEALLGDGIYRSTDGGGTWTRAPVPFASGYMGGGCAVESLAVDPANTAILLAAVYCPGTSSSSATAIIRSTNSGASWSGVGPEVGSSEDQAPSVTIDSSDSSGATWYATIAATGGYAGVWKSTDRGATWTQPLHSVPDAEKNAWSAPRGVVAVSPSHGNRLYALFESSYACTGSGCLNCAAGACGNATADPQLWTSDDGGATWTEITNEDQYGHTSAWYICAANQCSSTLTMAVSPSDPSTVYAGTLFPIRVTVSGSSSTYAYTQAPIHADERAFAFDPDGRLWVANDGGVYRYASESAMDTSVDDLNANLSTMQIYRLSVDSSGDILIATQDNGCDLYTSAGGWQQLGWGVGGVSEPMGCGDSSAAILSAVHPGVLYASVQYDMWIVRSLDGGQTIDHVQILGGCQLICTPFMDPVVEVPGTGALLAGANGQVWRADNPDAADPSTITEEAISPQFEWYPGAIAVAPSDAQTMYVGSSAYSNTTNQMGIEVTHDGGGTDPSDWSLGTGCCGTAPVTDIEVDPSNSSHAYATTSSWPPQSPRAGITADGGVSQVMETTDGGASWHNITGDLPAAPFNAVSVDWGFSKQTIYVATDVGVFWSEDDGTIWHATSSGLPAVSVQDLTIENGTLYAATFGRGVYSTTPVSTVLQTLTTAKSGGGSGTVSSSPTGIACGSTCTYDFAGSTSVTLTATASAGSTFTGWSGDCTGTGTCTVTMSAAHSVTATFKANPVVTVSKNGSGSGTVTSSPAGIDCGSSCSSHAFPYGSTVTLSATASSGSTFTGWSGDCTGTGSCAVTMSAAHSVLATFESPNSLAVTKTGNGAGTVTSSPAGIDCGSVCTHAFAHGTAVTLTAAPDSTSVFGGWSGDCAGTGTCTVTMNAVHSVAATFERLCIVPRVKGKKLKKTKAAIRKAHCSIGSVKRVFSKKVKKGRVISQRPHPGARRPPGAKVRLKVSRGSS